MSRRWLIAHHNVTLHICITPPWDAHGSGCVCPPYKNPSCRLQQPQGCCSCCRICGDGCARHSVFSPHTLQGVSLAPAANMGPQWFWVSLDSCRGWALQCMCRLHSHGSLADQPASFPSQGFKWRSTQVWYTGWETSCCFFIPMSSKEMWALCTGWKGQCWEKVVKHVTAFLPYCFQGFVLRSQMKWHFSRTAWSCWFLCWIQPVASFCQLHRHCGAVRA